MTTPETTAAIITAYEHASRMAAQTANMIALSAGEESRAARLAWGLKSQIDECAASFKRKNAVKLAVVGSDHD